MIFRSTSRFAALVALATGVLVAAPSSSEAREAREAWAKTSLSCTVRDGRIDEASGISRSTYRHGWFYMHNDSGDSARFFAVGQKCRTKAVFRVRHAVAADWEDMAAGPHHTLWFGDIGDNKTHRSSITVVRVKEPRKMRSRAVDSTSFRFKYADGPHNAEALMVRPRSGRIFVVTKSTSGAGIYRAPKHLSSRKVNVLQRVASVPFLVTGGDFAPNGRHFVLRSYSDAYLYSKIRGKGHLVNLPSQRQGEAIGFTRGGGALRVASEGVDQPVWRIIR